MAQPPMFYQRSPDYESNMRLAQQLMANPVQGRTPLAGLADAGQRLVGAWMARQEKEKDEARRKEYSAVLAQALQAAEPWQNPDTSSMPSMNAMERDATMGGGDGRRYLAPGEVAQGTGGQRAMIAALMGNELTAPLGTQMQFQELQNRQELERQLALERAKPLPPIKLGRGEVAYDQRTGAEMFRAPAAREQFTVDVGPNKVTYIGDKADQSTWQKVGEAPRFAPPAPQRETWNAPVPVMIDGKPVMAQYSNIGGFRVVDGAAPYTPPGTAPKTPEQIREEARARAQGTAEGTPQRVSVPAGYRFASDGVSLEAIPGGPADKRGERPAAPSGYAYAEDGSLQPIPGGPADKAGQREFEIKRYMNEYGLPREAAQGVADGVIKLSDNQQTGALTLTNVATGQSQLIQPSVPVTPRGPLEGIDPGSYGSRAAGQQGDVYSGEAFGPEPALTQVWNRTIALFDPESLTVPRQEEAIRTIEFAREGIIDAMLKNDRGAIAEQNRIMALLPRPGAFFENREVATKNLTEVWKIIARRRDRYANLLQSPRLTREMRKEADDALFRLDSVLAELGIPPEIASSNTRSPAAGASNVPPPPPGFSIVR